MTPFTLINNNMPGVTRVLQDNAQGTIIGPGASTVITEGQPTSVINDNVSTHGEAPHVSPTMTTGSGTVFAEGKPVVRKGDTASCGHAATGSGTVFAG